MRGPGVFGGYIGNRKDALRGKLTKGAGFQCLAVEQQGLTPAAQKSGACLFPALDRTA